LILFCRFSISSALALSRDFREEKFEEFSGKLLSVFIFSLYIEVAFI